MLKAIIIACLFGVSVFGQTIVHSTAAHPVVDGAGNLANGAIYVTPSVQFTTTGGIVVYPITTQVPVRGGIFTVALYPNDATSNPLTGTSYSARYSFTGGGSLPNESWIVPTSSSAVELIAVRTTPTPVPSYGINLSQILTTGCASGQVPAVSGGLFICTSSGNGTVTHSSGPLTGDQLVFGNGAGDIKPGNLTGDVTTSGGTLTSIGALRVTNAMLAGSIVAAKLIGSDIATVGTITAGTWNGTPINLASFSTGVLPATGFPALTGDVTTSAGSVATTVAKIAGVTVSGVTGTTNLVFSASPTIVTPTVASFVNATHNHTNAAGGGQITDAALSAAVTVPKGGTGVVTLAAHGTLIGEGTSTVVVGAPGTAGQCWTSNGASADPTMQPCGTGGGANLNLSNLAAVSINTALLAQSSVDLGSTANPFRNLILYGAGTYGTNSWSFSGTPTASRSVTIPDISGTMLIGASLTTGNAVVTNSVGNVADFGFIPNTHTYQAGCTGTAGPSAGGLQMVLYPPGNCSTTAGTFEQVSVLAPVASKLRNLRVHANVGGVNASSGVFTVITRGGGPTILTCTLGTATTCSDTTHVVSVSAGEQIYITFSTQAAETITDVNASLEY